MIDELHVAAQRDVAIFIMKDGDVFLIEYLLKVHIVEK